MSFDSQIIAFAERFLSDRTFQLIVAPAVADMQFEHSAGRLRQAANRVAVLRAVAGAVRDDLARVSGGILLLALLPACYNVFLLVMCFDVFSISISTDFVVVATLILVLSFTPAMVCFWPERQRAQPVE
jgi:phosphotransferase system  glucose/maltose/N-acetylglucosamine-specific IIC component